MSRTRRLSAILAVGLLLTAGGYTVAQAGTRQPGSPADGAGVHIILGRPTDREVTARVIPSSPAEVFIEYGWSPGAYTRRTEVRAASREQPATFVLDGLRPSSRHYYRLSYTRSQPGSSGLTEEFSFMTARNPGEPFSFVVQADSHLLNKADRPTYARAMREMAGLQPDFFFDLGDTFLNDKDPAVPFATVNDIYYEQVPYLATVARTAPLFLVIGNHEGEYGYLLGGTADNLSVYATRSRRQYYPNPLPNAFYSGNASHEPLIGLPENYYAFTWGDALFVALDPYRYTVKDPSGTKDMWDWTLGEAQYRWLKNTLEGSTARFKFVFSHHAIGNIRGGAKIASLYEWGGKGNRGMELFAQKRPGWEKPIHQLLRDTRVTIFFQGHDHLFARETVDGVIYQTLPKPAEIIPDQQSNRQYFEGADLQINSGYLQVRVDPDEVRVDYLRTVVAGHPDSASTGLGHSYAVDASGEVTVLKRTDDSAAFEAYEHAEGGEVRSPGGDRQEKTDRGKGAEPAASAASPSRSEQGRIEPAGSLHARPFLGSPSEDGITISAVFETASRSYYRLCYADAGAGTFTQTDLFSFRTRQPPGWEFTFLVQADPHLDESSSASTYRAILAAMARDGADFVVDLGDSSMVEKLAADKEEVRQRNLLMRSYWQEIAHSAPFFMVLGNHDGETGWRQPRGRPTAEEAAAVRRTFFANPEATPGSMYSGPSDTAFSWEWGDALFIILDPYTYTRTKPKEDNWVWTLGKSQYDWLVSVLRRSTARFRFVFIHNLVGGLDPDGRGGAEAAELYEWGGHSADGAYDFASRRPGWKLPIQRLFEEHDVDVVFHGHDHFYARQELNGIVYQLVPQPTFGGKQTVSDLAAEYGYQEGVFLSSPGYLRIRVSPHSAVVELIQGSEGRVSHSYTIAP